MKKEFIAKAREKLLVKKHSLEARLDEVGEKIEKDGYQTKFPNYGDDEESSVSEVEDYDTNVDLEKNLIKDLKATNLALKRINEGKFGICPKCGQEINPQRLDAYPAAAICLNCENKK